LTGNGANWTYTPDAGFYGDDEIRFEVSDGLFTSAEAVVAITVTRVNQPPVLAIDVDDEAVATSPPGVGRRAALGFPILLTSTFTDDLPASYEAHLDWGDGTVDTTGQFVDGDGESPRVDGVAISPPALPGMEGHAYAQHTYTSPGIEPAALCVVDSDGAAGCDHTLISVEDVVSLGVGAKVFADSAGEDAIVQTQIGDGVPFQYQLTVTNGMPSVGDGVVAADITLHGELPPQLVTAGVSATKGSCTLNGDVVDCALGSLIPGQDVTLTVSLSGPGNLRADTDMDFSGEVMTTSPALESPRSFFVSTTVVPKAENLCVGDCNSDGMVTIDEVVKAVNIALGTLPLAECRASDSNRDVAVTVNELVTAVRRALGGCP